MEKCLARSEKLSAAQSQAQELRDELRIALSFSRGEYLKRCKAESELRHCQNELAKNAETLSSAEKTIDRLGKALVFFGVLSIVTLACLVYATI